MKVVGIGLPKTGTTSLAAALTILGYRTKHHPMDYHDRIMKDGNYYLRDFDCDAIVNTAEDFYPTIYYHNPHVKFILTTRELEPWLLSWSKKDRPFADQSEIQYLDRIRIFGTCRFVSEHFAEVFARHHSYVEWFFRDKPGSLLVLSLEDENKWEKLCDFLDKPVPDCPYPYNRRTPL